MDKLKTTNLFDADEKDRAKAILKQLDGLSIASAQELLDRCIGALTLVMVDTDRLDL